MNGGKRQRLPMLALMLFSLAGRSARADAPATRPETQTDLRQEVQELKAQVARLQGKQDQDDAVTAGMIQRVLADAQRHSQFLDASGAIGSAGFVGNRFIISSEDGNFTFRPWIHMQFRESTSFRQDFKGGGTADDVQNGFELRRAKLGFDGNLFSKDLTYYINWASNRGNGSLTVKNGSNVVGATNSPVGGVPVLEEAWLRYHFADTPFSIHVGQIHDPFSHETIIGSKYRAPEVSLQGDIFGNTDTFTQAATLIYDNNGPIRIEGGVTDGIRAANTNFQDFPNNGINYDGGVAGRIEYKIMGDWKDYNQLTALNDKSDLLVIGSGYDYSWGGNFSSLSHTLDVQYGSPSGLFAYGSYIGRYTQHNPGIPSGGSVSTSFGSPNGEAGRDTYEPSLLGQVSYLINGKLEPYLRYEYLHLQGTPAGSQNNVNEISLGANYYFYGHNLKLTGQAMYLPNGIPVNDDSSDVLIGNRKGEFVFITQLQLLL